MLGTSVFSYVPYFNTFKFRNQGAKTVNLFVNLPYICDNRFIINLNEANVHDSDDR